MEELTFESYSPNTSDQDIYKIGMIGASRIGKTSLISALLHQAENYYNRDTVSIKPRRRTNSTIKINISTMNRGIQEGIEDKTRIFKPKLASSTYPSIFHLVMTIKNSSNFFKKILEPDYYQQLNLQNLKEIEVNFANPGQESEWGENWQKCQSWIQDSSVLMVIVDAALVMETDNENQQQRVQDLMNITEINRQIDRWVQNKKEKRQSGLLLFVPVKCESYFNDNTGQLDESLALYKCITEYYYKDIIHDVKQKIDPDCNEQQGNFKEPTLTIAYHPIDTIGCIEIARSHWKIAQNQSVLNCDYRLRDSNELKRKPFGTMDLFFAICKQISAEGFNQTSSGFQVQGFTLKKNNQKELFKKAIDTLEEIINQQDSRSSRVKTIAKGAFKQN